MKLRGQDIEIDNEVEVEIRPDLKITVTALPLGFETQASKIFPAPKPPMKYATNAAGKVLRDSSGPIREEDVDDPVYVDRLSLVQQRQMMFILWKALASDDIEWDFTKNHSDPKTEEFVDAMFEELKVTGFTTGDLTKLMQATLTAGNMGDEVERDREDF